MFPSTPNDGDTVTINGKKYLYIAASNLWQLQPIDLATDTEQGLLSAADKSKLDAIEPGATADMTPAEIVGAYEGVSGVNRFSDADKSKLDGLDDHFVGVFTTDAALDAVTGSPGDYADVDAGVGTDIVRKIWDDDDSKWVVQSGAVGGETNASIKTKLLANPDTNVLTDDELANVQRDSVTLKTSGPTFPSTPEIGDEHYWTTDSSWYKWTLEGANTFWLNL